MQNSNTQRTASLAGNNEDKMMTVKHLRELAERARRLDHLELVVQAAADGVRRLDLAVHEL